MPDEVKVVDRRRFRADGEPAEAAGSEPAEASAPGGGADEDAPARSTPDDARLAAQASRIDELSRAYAGLVEDNKAFRGRLERERDRVVDAERANVAQALLEAADDLERALAAVSGAREGQGGALHTLAEGVRLSLAGLHKRIADLGAERIQVVGERFDPRVAEAIDAVPTHDAAQDDVVVQEVRPGYRIGERVLRPARVRVGRLARA
jgi:molecular chaperone GrpE